MSFLAWTSDLNTNVEMVDVQHRKLVDYINELHEIHDDSAHSEEEKMAMTGEIIKKLLDYTVKHFSDEEALMTKAGYRLTDRHKMIHDKFIAKIGEMYDRHQSGINTNDELLAMLETWLFSHIRTHDRGYLPTVLAYIKEHPSAGRFID